MAAKHEKLLQQTFLLIQKTFPQSRVFPRHVGTFFKFNGSPIKINHKGMADAYMLIPYNGKLIHIELEFKVGSDKQSKEQKQWQQTIENMSGLYLLVRCPYECIQQIQQHLKD